MSASASVNARKPLYGLLTGPLGIRRRLAPTPEPDRATDPAPGSAPPAAAARGDGSMPELLDQHRSRPLERPQRLGLPARAVQRQHVLGLQPLVKRVLVLSASSSTATSRWRPNANSAPAQSSSANNRSCLETSPFHQQHRSVIEPGEGRTAAIVPAQSAVSRPQPPDRQPSSARPRPTSDSNSSESSDESSTRSHIPPCPRVRSP